jgi:hypothetical protein
MNRRPGGRPHGQIRRSQLITSFGPGSMMDLPNHSVLIGGFDSWSTGGDEVIEPRLVDKLKELFDPPLLVRIVVDSEYVFVSSANFTQAAQERNIEVGLNIRSNWLASRLIKHFRRLHECGLATRAF